MGTDKLWTASKVTKLFRTEIPTTTLIRAEEQKRIPEAIRLTRGKIQARAWRQEQLPDLGRVYGFMKEPNETQIITVYTPKGGVLKSTTCYTLARTAALNGIPTLVVGLDVQGSITKLLSKPMDEYDSIDDIVEPAGLYEATGVNPTPIEQVIQVSDLPTLHYIPESLSLTLLEQNIRDAKKREFFLSKAIEPLKSKYKLIFFDNAPNWSFLIQNALTAANHVISPLGCDPESYRSVNRNIEIITQFQQEMDLQWDSFTVIPTLRENTKISSQIEAAYRRSFSDFITASAIRRAVIGQESSLRQVTVFESDPSSLLAQDYFETIKELWPKIAGE